MAGSYVIPGDEKPTMSTSTSLDTGSVQPGGPLVTPSMGFDGNLSSTGNLRGGAMPGGKGEFVSPVK